jgi:hypothetical protein
LILIKASADRGEYRQSCAHDKARRREAAATQTSGHQALLLFFSVD